MICLKGADRDRATSPARAAAATHEDDPAQPKPRLGQQRSILGEALRGCPDTCLVWHYHPAPAHPRRSPPGQRRSLPGRDRAHAVPRTDPRLRRPPHPERTHQARSSAASNASSPARSGPTCDRSASPLERSQRHVDGYGSINAMIEPLWSRIQVELLDRNRWRSGPARQRDLRVPRRNSTEPGAGQSSKPTQDGSVNRYDYAR